jgi:hypothetical protein
MFCVFISACSKCKALVIVLVSQSRSSIITLVLFFRALDAVVAAARRPSAFVAFSVGTVGAVAGAHHLLLHRLHNDPKNTPSHTCHYQKSIPNCHNPLPPSTPTIWSTLKKIHVAKCGQGPSTVYSRRHSSKHEWAMTPFSGLHSTDGWGTHVALVLGEAWGGDSGPVSSCESTSSSRICKENRIEIVIRNDPWATYNRHITLVLDFRALDAVVATARRPSAFVAFIVRTVGAVAGAQGLIVVCWHDICWRRNQKKVEILKFEENECAVDTSPTRV